MYSQDSIIVKLHKYKIGLFPVTIKSMVQLLQLGTQDLLDHSEETECRLCYHHQIASTNKRSLLRTCINEAVLNTLLYFEIGAILSVRYVACPVAK